VIGEKTSTLPWMDTDDADQEEIAKIAEIEAQNH
jgi:hypothetical protein